MPRITLALVSWAVTLTIPFITTAVFTGVASVDASDGGQARDASIGYWSPATSTAGRRLETDKRSISTLALARRDRFLAAGSNDRILIWDTANWKRMADIKTGYQVWSIASFPNSSRLVVGGGDGNLELIEFDRREQRLRLAGHKDSVLRVACSPDGSTVASGGFDGRVRLWDATQRRATRELALDGTTIFALSFSPDGRYLGIRTQGEMLVIWDIAAGRETLRQREQGLNARTIAFSPDGTRFATSQSSRSVVMRETRTGRDIFTRESSFGEVFWPPQRDHLYVISGPVLSLWDSRTGIPHGSARIADGWLQAFVIMNDSRTIATADSDSSIVIHDLTGKGWFTTEQRPTVPPHASVNGRYSNLVRILPAPDDSKTHGSFHEAGYRSQSRHETFGTIPAGFHVFFQDNWYIFENSRIGLHHPPASLPQPAKLSSGKWKLWIAIAQASICRRATEEAVAEIPGKVEAIKHATMIWQHSFEPPKSNPETWFGTGILELTMDAEMPTEELLETLRTRMGFSFANAVVLGETGARAAKVFSESVP